MPAEIHPELLTYAVVRERLGTGRAHLLLGNGFSVACDPIFTYPSLYDAAVAAGLSARAQTIFAYLGSNNFEGVMRLLDEAHFVATTYGLVEGARSAMLDDLDTVKQALIQAVAQSHPAHTGAIPDDKKRAAASFIRPYHNVFTTNYDLLLYWVNVAAGDPPPYGDGFRPDPDDPDAPSLVFTEHLGGGKGILMLHGGLHLFSDKGALRKHSWRRSGKRLTESILQALALGGFPLFVAEGVPDKKMEQIRKNAYLSYALGKFGRIENPLVVFGHSLGASDSHINDTIAANEKLRSLYIGLFGDAKSDTAQQTKAAVRTIAADWARQCDPNGRRRLDIFFYDSATAQCWAPPEPIADAPSA